MIWNLSGRQRYRMAMALAVGFVLIFAASWFVNHTIGKINEEFKSVYDDRLVPAADIARLVERFYQNQILLEQHLHVQSATEKASIQQEVEQHNKTIAQLIAKYSVTYFTEKEEAYFKEFASANKQLQNLQTQILESDNQSIATGIYNKAYKAQIHTLLEQLHLLTSLQEEVGQELYLTAERQVKLLKMISSLVIAIAMIIALFVGSLMQSSRKIAAVKPQKFHLN